MVSATALPQAAPPRAAPCRARARGRSRGLLAALLLLAAGCSSAPGQRGTVEGTVVGQDGHGVAGVTVTLSGPAAAELRTDAQGRYAFRRLPSGTYTVSLRGQSGAPVPGSRTRVVAGNGRRRTRADFAVLSAALTRIADIQGRGHLSPLAGRAVSSVAGIVTALRAPAGFYIQSPLPDSTPDTSEGVFVAVTRMPEVAPGDLVLVDGTVEEHYAEGPGSGGLPVTRLALLGFRRLGRDFDLPAPVVLGRGGRRPPDRIICNDAGGDAERSTFDPAEDGLDFYESLEGMLVQVNEPLVVGTLDAARGELQVVGDAGGQATTLTARGGLALLAGDSNPERITLDTRGLQLPPQPLVVGDRFLGPIAGPLDYEGSGYRIHPSHPLPQVSRANLPRQSASLPVDEGTLTCALVDVPSLAAGAREKAAEAAETIVKALHSPQVVVVIETQGGPAQGDEGAAGSERVSRLLLDAIRAAGGPPTYRWREVNPVNGTAAGDRGAGPRIGFLYDRERVQLVERMGESSRSAVLVREASGRPDLSFSPGLVALGELAFRDTRSPLAAEFLFRGRRLFVVAAHFASRSDAPPFGRVQPPKRAEDAVRMMQARALNGFVSSILSSDPAADVVVLGDFSEPAWSPAMLALKGPLLFDLAEQLLPPQERYTYVDRGNSEDRDHILVSKNLLERGGARLEIVHRYAEYAHESRFSGHDPLIAAFKPR